MLEGWLETVFVDIMMDEGLVVTDATEWMEAVDVEMGSTFFACRDGGRGIEGEDEEFSLE